MKDAPSRDDILLTQEAAGTPKPRWAWKKLGGKFLVISIAVHVLLGLAATLYVVQTQTARKLTFKGGPPSPNPATRALEHKIQLAKKQTTSAPSLNKRITTTGLSKVALPDMPSMPKLSAAPTQMASGGNAGQLMGLSGAPGSAGVSGLTMFGFRNAKSGGLRGDFYDLKQTSDGKPSGMTVEIYGKTVSALAKNGFRESELAKFYKAPTPLYAAQIFMPSISADEGPKAFGVEQLVAPKMWVVVYRGKVTAPVNGRFRFVGIGDDVFAVRFQGRVVLDHGSYSMSGWKADRHYSYDPAWMRPGARAWYTSRSGHAVGDEFEVREGNSYDLEVLIGEQPGGSFTAQLFIEKSGETYQKDPKGSPILPVFRMANSANPEVAGFPPFAPDGPIWKGEATTLPGFAR